MNLTMSGIQQSNLGHLLGYLYSNLSHGAVNTHVALETFHTQFLLHTLKDILKSVYIYSALESLRNSL